MKILIVSNFFPPETIGGAELVAHRHALEMSRRQHDVAVFTGRLSDDRNHELETSVIDGVRVYRSPRRPLSPDESFHSMASAENFAKVLAEFRPTVVHFHNVAGLGANLIPQAGALGYPTLVTLHDYWGFCLRQTRLRRNLQVCANEEECHLCLSHVITARGNAVPVRLRRDYVAWCLDHADRLVSPSASVAAAYAAAGIGEGRLVVRSNGIDTAGYRLRTPRPAQKIRFLFVGHLGEHKGLGILLDALAQLRARTDLNDRWSMSIVGDGPLRGAVRRAVRDLRHGDITQLGHVGSGAMPDLYQAHDVVVLPSIWPENEPVVLLEAMASGLAQIATRTGGNVALVPQTCGLLVPAGDPRALADAMAQYILHPALAAEHGEANARRRSAFEQAVSCDEYEDDYRTISQSPSAMRHDALVICAGTAPDAATNLAVNRLAVDLQGKTRIRLVSSEWADAAAWSSARALWAWRMTPDPASLRQAQQHGLPILIPIGRSSVALKQSYGRVVEYRHVAQIGALLARLAHPDTPLPVPVGLRSEQEARIAARLQNVVLSQRAKTLHALRGLRRNVRGLLRGRT